MMRVTPPMLAKGAAEVRRRKRGPQEIPRVPGVIVSAAQLDTAARLLREAEPARITRISGTPLSGPAETPRDGYISAHSQDKDQPDVLVFEIGILGSRHRIDRKGRVL